VVVPAAGAGVPPRGRLGPVRAAAAGGERGNGGGGAGAAVGVGWLDALALERACLEAGGTGRLRRAGVCGGPVAAGHPAARPAPLRPRRRRDRGRARTPLYFSSGAAS